MKNTLILAGLFSATAVCAAEFAPVDVLIYTRWDYVKNEKTGIVAKGGTYGATSRRTASSASSRTILHSSRRMR